MIGAFRGYNLLDSASALRRLDFRVAEVVRLRTEAAKPKSHDSGYNTATLTFGRNAALVSSLE